MFPKLVSWLWFLWRPRENVYCTPRSRSEGQFYGSKPNPLEKPTVHSSRRLLTILLLATTLCAMIASAQEPISTLSIDVGSVKGEVSPMLYGLMTEEINYSYDGGLYAELIRNRAFTDNRRMQPFHWFLYESGNADASMVMDMSTGPSAALPLSLQVTIRSATDQAPAGVANEGYWGIAVRPRTTYHGSFC